MSVLHPSRNLAARMGRWSASHRKLAIFGWLAFVISAVVIGTAVGQKTIDNQNNNVGQAHRADQILKQAGFTQSGAIDRVRAHPERQGSRSGIPRSARWSATSAGAVSPYRSRFHNLRSPLAPANRSQVTHDGHTALVEFDMNGTQKCAETQIDPLTARLRSVARATPEASTSARPARSAPTRR